MRRVVSLVLLAACLAGALSIVAVTGVRGAALEKVVVGPAASGKSRALDTGDVLVVRLPSNPSTGFSWQVRSDARPMLVLVARTYRPPQGGLLGAPGTAVLRFRAAAAGRKIVRLAYVRPWEKGVEPARTFTLRVTVTR